MILNSARATDFGRHMCVAIQASARVGRGRIRHLFWKATANAKSSRSHSFCYHFLLVSIHATHRRKIDLANPIYPVYVRTNILTRLTQTS